MPGPPSTERLSLAALTFRAADAAISAASPAAVTQGVITVKESSMNAPGAGSGSRT